MIARRPLWALALLASLVIVAVAAGCGAATPEVIEKEVVVEKPVVQTVVIEKERVVEKPVVATVVVEKQVAVKETVVVEKVVKETVVVEKEVIVEQPGVGPAGEIVVLTGIDSNTLDPYQMTTTNPEGNIARHLWDRLVWRDADGTIVPQLARSWRIIDDTTWEFKLRDDVYFHNGEHFTAEAVKYSLERARDLEESVDTTANNIFYDSTEILDDYTLRIKTSKPAAGMLFYLWGFTILPPKYYSETPLEVLVENPVGSGPYKFVSWDRDGPFVMEANLDYWGKLPDIKRITFRAVPEAGARIAELEAGSAHLITNVPPDQTNLVETANSRLEAVEGYRRIFVFIRCEEGKPWADKRVRHAMNYAVDVDTIGETLFAGFAQRYGSWVNPPNNNPALAPWPYDPDKAKSLLAEAGYADGFDVVLNTPVGRYNKDKESAEIIADYLGEVGIRAEVVPVDWSTYVQEMLIPQKNLQLGILGLGSGANDLADAQNLQLSWPFNVTGCKSDEFEALYTEAQATLNDVKRQELLFQAQEIMYDLAPWIWLWRQYDFYGVSNQLEWSPRADESIDFRPSRLK